MSDDQPLSIIVPVFDEEASIGAVLDQLLEVRAASPWEIIAVDDGSSDDTARILDAYASRIRVIRHPANRGYGASLKTGLQATRAENVLFFDGDGQHDAADIPAFVEALRRYECVFGARPKGAGIPAVHKPRMWLLQKVCNFLAAQKIPDINSGFRAGRRRIFMLMLDLLPNGFSFSTTSLIYVLKSRFSYTFLPIRCHPSKGASSVRILYDSVRTVLLVLRLIMLFAPMRALGYPAMALIAAGVIFQAYVIAAFRLRIFGEAFHTILAGVILLLFGLLGDQVASLRKEISLLNSLFREDQERRERKERT